MRITSLLKTSRNPFSSLVSNSFDKSNNWSNVDRLIFDNLTNKEHKTAESVLKVAYKGLKFQIFDYSFWNQIHDVTIKNKKSFSPSQWVQLLHIFKRIKIQNNNLYNIAIEQLNDNLSYLSLKELSILSLSFSYFSICSNTLFNNIAKTIASRHDDFKSKEIESIVNHTSAFDKASEPQSLQNNCRSINDFINDTVSYIHLIGSYSKCGFDSKMIFEVATENILKNINHGVVIQPNLIMKLLNSYSRFGYRHNELFDHLCSQIITSKLSNEDLNEIKNIFSKLNYENETLNDILAYRLGNLK